MEVYLSNVRYSYRKKENALKDNFPAVFTPGNEPYLGLKSLLWFDKVIIWTMEGTQSVASFTHTHREKLSELKQAACQIIPQGITIALSIRELIRQAYLFPAQILIRPLIERAAVISYLCLYPDYVALWHSGWEYGKRPSLAKMMHATSEDKVDLNEAKNVCDANNHIVHGDPIGSYYNLIHLSDGMA